MQTMYKEEDLYTTKSQKAHVLRVHFYTPLLRSFRYTGSSDIRFAIKRRLIAKWHPAAPMVLQRCPEVPKWSPRVLQRCQNGPPGCQNGGPKPREWQLRGAKAPAAEGVAKKLVIHSLITLFGVLFASMIDFGQPLMCTFNK